MSGPARLRHLTLQPRVIAGKRGAVFTGIAADGSTVEYPVPNGQRLWWLRQVVNVLFGPEWDQEERIEKGGDRP